MPLFVKSEKQGLWALRNQDPNDENCIEYESLTQQPRHKLDASNSLTVYLPFMALEETNIGHGQTVGSYGFVICCRRSSPRLGCSRTDTIRP